MPTPLVLVHGAWLSARSWDTFKDYFGRRGFDVSTPEWPRKAGDVAELREHADEIAGLGLDEIVVHHAQLIEQLPAPPVIIGHSFGGLITERLLDLGLGRAGVAISPAPPRGIRVLPFSSLKAASPALAHPSRWHGVVTLTLEQFTYGFVNTFSPEDAKTAYETYAVPETGQIFYEAGFANFSLHSAAEVQFANDHRAPLLIVGLEQDHTVPASVSSKQAARYEHSAARTDYEEFPGRPHLAMVAEGWEEIASSIDAWLAGVLAAAPATGAAN